MSRRVAWVTGASGGIGLETARQLGKRGLALRVVARDRDKLANAVTALQRVCPDVLGFRADFSSLEAVRELSRAALALDEPIHVLVNNAGVWHPEFRASTDGYEDTFAVNHLAPFLLTLLLLPRMRETEGDRRIVHVSSRLHIQAGQTSSLRGRAIHALNVMGLRVGATGARLDLDAIDRRDGYRGLEAYARSKLAQVVFSAELSRRETSVTSNAVHPGSVATDVTRDNAVLTRLAPLVRGFLKTPAQGARTSVFVACDASLRGVSGRYFANEREATPGSIAKDAAVGRQLWSYSCAHVGL